MRRRQFLGLLGGAAASPFVRTCTALAQQAAMPVIGFINGQRAAEFAHLVAAFHEGLNQGGYVEGRNVAVEYRWAEGKQDAMPALVADLLQRQVTVLVHGGAIPTAAIAATKTVPIVTTFGGDPVRLGFTTSINRPGANITGASVFTTDLEAKRLELLRELLPGGTLTGVLRDPSFSEADTQLREIEAAARTLGERISMREATNEGRIETAYASFAHMRVTALLVAGSPFFNARRTLIVALSARHAIPTMQETRESALAGGLISYGPNISDVYRKLGAYAARVIGGEKLADLPIQRPTKFDLVINLKTAKALGVEVPTSILLRADEVIE
jgi:putative tryptophan/tyrosine transport system substrate-binding protein